MRYKLLLLASLAGLMACNCGEKTPVDQGTPEKPEKKGDVTGLNSFFSPLVLKIANS